MPKPKQFVKGTTKKNAKPKAVKQGPETADEFLEAGVEFEEAGEKWRAGDAAKSTRFFIRAIDNYDAALRKYPDSFDNAYNKARVQYQITQHPTLAAQVPTSIAELLRIALESHRYALKLEQDNADVLFNTAQVLTSLAEALTENVQQSPETRTEAVKSLQEAVELFQRCLALQEFQFTESQKQMQMAKEQEAVVQDEQAEAPPSSVEPEVAEDSPDNDDQHQWAFIEEPVTTETILDTAIAQLETLIALCGLMAGAATGNDLAWIEEYATNLIQTKVQNYAMGTDRMAEAALTRANLMCALAEAGFRSGRIDVETYEREVRSAFYDVPDLSQDPEGLCERAEALVSFNVAVQESLVATPDALDQQALDKLSAVRWEHLSTALASLTAASKLPSADNAAKIHIARGDVELLRLRLGDAPSHYAAAFRNAPTLAKNAQTYYRGAAAVARSIGSSKEAIEGSIKEAVAAFISGNSDLLRNIQRGAGKQQIVDILEEMFSDGLVGNEFSVSLEPLGL